MSCDADGESTVAATELQDSQSVEVAEAEEGREMSAFGVQNAHGHLQSARPKLLRSPGEAKLVYEKELEGAS